MKAVEKKQELKWRENDNIIKGIAVECRLKWGGGPQEINCLIKVFCWLLGE
jgi:hypothetical protein